MELSPAEQFYIQEPLLPYLPKFTRHRRKQVEEIHEQAKGAKSKYRTNPELTRYRRVNEAVRGKLANSLDADAPYTELWLVTGKPPGDDNIYDIFASSHELNDMLLAAFNEAGRQPGQYLLLTVAPVIAPALVDFREQPSHADGNQGRLAPKLISEPYLAAPYELPGRPALTRFAGGKNNPIFRFSGSIYASEEGKRAQASYARQLTAMALETIVDLCEQAVAQTRPKTSPATQTQPTQTQPTQTQTEDLAGVAPATQDEPATAKISPIPQKQTSDFSKSASASEPTAEQTPPPAQKIPSPHLGKSSAFSDDSHKSRSDLGYSDSFSLYRISLEGSYAQEITRRVDKNISNFGPLSRNLDRPKRGILDPSVKNILVGHLKEKRNLYDRLNR